MWTVTRRAALAATAGSLLLLVLPGHVGWLLAVDAVLALAVVADHLRTPDPRTLEVERDVPRTVRLDGSAELTWSVRSPHPRRLLVALADELRPSLGAGQRRVRLVVPAAGRARRSTRLRPTRRGTTQLQGVTLRVWGPWRLGARQRRVDVPGRITVLPDFPSRERAELRAHLAVRADAGLRTVRGAAGGTDFESLRDYTVDDDPRHIDWVATARTRAPVVRTYQPERNQTVIALVDAARTSAGRVGGAPRLDGTLDAALALTLVATRLGDRVGAVVFDEHVRAMATPRSGRDQSRVVAATLADAQPRLVEPDFAGAFAATLARFRRRALLVVLTDLSPGSAETTLLPALGLVTRHHAVVVVGADDPAVAGWAVHAPDDASEAYLAAAASRELEQRRALRHRMTRTGARVLSPQPQHLADDVVDAYLDVKRRGQL